MKHWMLARIPDANVETLREMIAEGYERFAVTPTKSPLGPNYNWLRRSREEPALVPITDPICRLLEEGWMPVLVTDSPDGPSEITFDYDGATTSILFWNTAQPTIDGPADQTGPPKCGRTFHHARALADMICQLPPHSGDCWDALRARATQVPQGRQT